MLCYGKFVFLVSLAFVYLCTTLRICTFHVNRLSLCIFTGRYTYLPKIYIYCNIYATSKYVYTQPSMLIYMKSVWTKRTVCIHKLVSIQTNQKYILAVAYVCTVLACIQVTPEMVH